VRELTLQTGDLLTVQRALEILPIGKTLLYELIHDGQIPAIRVHSVGSRRGRILIHRADLAAYVERARHGATRAPVLPDVDAIHRRVRRNLPSSRGNDARPAET